jgi:hypothetical protein
MACLEGATGHDRLAASATAGERDARKQLTEARHLRVAKAPGRGADLPPTELDPRVGVMVPGLGRQPDHEHRSVALPPEQVHQHERVQQAGGPAAADAEHKVHRPAECLGVVAHSATPAITSGEALGEPGQRLACKQKADARKRKPDPQREDDLRAQR